MKKSTGIAGTALAAWLDRDETEIAKLLTQPVQIRYNRGSLVGEVLQRESRELLQRTIEQLQEDGNAQHAIPTVEVLLGDIPPRHPSARHVHVTWTEQGVWISSQVTPRHHAPARLHPIVMTIAACYVAAAAVNALLGYAFLPIDREVCLQVKDLLGPDPSWAHENITLGESVLAGAGAIGNGFMTGLARFSVSGRLYISDPKVVKDSILPRCLWFDADDLEQPKAEILARKATPKFQQLDLIPWNGTVSELRVSLPGAKIERLIVGVDSRRARRRLQSELPREVYDASTTGITELVLHFNRARDYTACMACIYKEEMGELQHEAHVAQVLGISIDAVRREFVTRSDAQAIVNRHPDLKEHSLIGRAFDSLFRERCAEGKLPTDSDRQVLPPLPFVSVLAGAWLALETVRRLATLPTTARFNYWRLSPWHSPNLALQQIRPKDIACECCCNESVREANAILWH